MYGDCGKFLMSDEITGECSGGAIKEKDGWKVEGKPMPIKVSPINEPIKEQEKSDRTKGRV